MQILMPFLPTENSQEMRVPAYHDKVDPCIGELRQRVVFVQLLHHPELLLCVVWPMHLEVDLNIQSKPACITKFKDDFLLFYAYLLAALYDDMQKAFQSQSKTRMISARGARERKMRHQTAKRSKRFREKLALTAPCSHQSGCA
jgi:hypothetical protein